MNDKELTSTQNSNRSFFEDIKHIIEEGRKRAYASVSVIQIRTNWNIGKRIVEEEQKGSSKAAYGISLIDQLSENISKDFPQGYSPRDLRRYRLFYLRFKDL